MIPYALVLLVAAVWLAARHFYSPASSARSKRLVTLLTFSSIAAAGMLPQVFRAAAFVQLFVCVYVILYAPIDAPNQDQIPPRREPLVPSAAPDVQRKL